MIKNNNAGLVASNMRHEAGIDDDTDMGVVAAAPEHGQIERPGETVHKPPDAILPMTSLIWADSSASSCTDA